jgi:hypothetical protein
MIKLVFLINKKEKIIEKVLENPFEILSPGKLFSINKTKEYNYLQAIVCIGSTYFHWEKNSIITIEDYKTIKQKSVYELEMGEIDFSYSIISKTIDAIVSLLFKWNTTKYYNSFINSFMFCLELLKELKYEINKIFKEEMGKNYK